MATDATGVATSPDGIPTYNTAVDAPSGKGFNAAMAAIQTALSNRAATPAGILSGEAAIWNGASWARSSVTGLLPSGISGYPSDATKTLRGDGSWGKTSELLWDSTGVTLPAATITTAALGSNFKNLVVEISAVQNAGTDQNFYVRLNGDATAANYSSNLIHITGGTITGSRDTLSTGLQLGISRTGQGFLGTLRLPAYSVGGLPRSIVSQGTSSNDGWSTFGNWTQTSVISTLSFFCASGSLSAGTQICVYGEA